MFVLVFVSRDFELGIIVSCEESTVSLVRPLPTRPMSLKLKKLFVDVRTYYVLTHVRTYARTDGRTDI